MLASFEIGPPRMAALRPVLLVAPIRLPIQPPLAMLNWWGHRGRKRDQICTWQPAPTRSWSSVRIVSYGRTGPVVLKLSSSQTIKKRDKQVLRRQQAQPRRHPRRLSPCPQQPCRNHDQPNCACFHSETTFVGRAEGGDRSFHRPTGEDLRRPG